MTIQLFCGNWLALVGQFAAFKLKTALCPGPIVVCWGYPGVMLKQAETICGLTDTVDGKNPRLLITN